MEQYISKSALVAEIEKIIEEPAPSHDSQCPWEDGYYCGLYKAESIIDSLEVKEVDLDFEKELYKAFGQVKDFTLGMCIARHFYELGLNAKK